MAACKTCGCSGWFFKLDADGLCLSCAPLVHMDVEQRRQIVEESALGAENTLNPHSKIVRMKTLVENLDKLADYEKKGVDALGGSAGKRRDQSKENLDALILKTARTELDEVLKRMSSVEDSEEKVTLLSAFLVKLEEYKDRPRHRKKIGVLATKVKNTIYRIRLNAHLKLAKRSEDGGEPELARKHYQEALTYLKSSSSQDAEKEDALARITDKLKQLSKPS